MVMDEQQYAKKEKEMYESLKELEVAPIEKKNE